MDFIIKRRNNADAIEHVTGTSILIRPGDRRYANLHVLNRGRAVFTAPTDWVEIQDCGRCLAITLGDARHQRVPPITIPTRIHDKTRGLWVSRLYIRSRSE